MPSTLILDMRDPEVAEVVAQWQQNGRYFLNLEVTQETASKGEVRFAVDHISDYGPADVEEEAESGNAPAPPMPPGGMEGAAMMGLLGRARGTGARGPGR